MDDQTRQTIEQQVAGHRVFLYMKGTPSFPQCGFSGQAVALLKHHGVEFGSCNVLENPDIRNGIKEFADWPTIPQLYVEGQFVGGCDIMIEMHNSGQLKETLADKNAQA